MAAFVAEGEALVRLSVSARDIGLSDSIANELHQLACLRAPLVMATDTLPGDKYHPLTRILLGTVAAQEATKAGNMTAAAEAAMNAYVAAVSGHWFEVGHVSIAIVEATRGLCGVLKHFSQNCPQPGIPAFVFRSLNGLPMEVLSAVLGEYVDHWMQIVESSVTGSDDNLRLIALQFCLKLTSARNPWVTKILLSHNIAQPLTAALARCTLPTGSKMQRLPDRLAVSRVVVAEVAIDLLKASPVEAHTVLMGAAGAESSEIDLPWHRLRSEGANRWGVEAVFARALEQAEQHRRHCCT